jgi:hypothetical protein
MADGETSTEPELDPTDPYAREGQTFPRLSEDMAGETGRSESRCRIETRQ